MAQGGGYNPTANAQPNGLLSQNKQQNMAMQNPANFVTGAQGVVMRPADPRQADNEKYMAHYNETLNGPQVGPAGFQRGVSQEQIARMQARAAEPQFGRGHDGAMARRQYERSQPGYDPSRDQAYLQSGAGQAEQAGINAEQAKIFAQYGSGPSGSWFGNNAVGDPDKGPFAATGGTWLPGYDYAAKNMTAPVDPRTGKPIVYK